ncbi:hypothetical protein KGD83_11905 [Nocardiopsis akebiae]|uniref:Uncharacterized protein n=1 Tax=Nocardiopsis akebiae TaxID=2831968 RepID=A0ABX8C9M1_9ACTN|nr:hypothetical protein [Nocardiopsis akebiae]QUX31126.1 hypothetical protein KGD83_11905 [Nocardiopsis akebiae]
MNVQLSVHGPTSDAEFRSLYRWLRGEGGNLRAAGITMEHTGGTPDEPDVMGGAFEVVQFVCDFGAQYGALAVAIASWRRAHPARSSFTLERNGVKITLTEAELDDLPAVLRALEELRDADEPEDGE